VLRAGALLEASAVDAARGARLDAPELAMRGAGLETADASLRGFGALMTTGGSSLFAPLFC
jgi:hypothetical protein